MSKINSIYFNFDTKECACEFIDKIVAINFKNKGVTMCLDNPLKIEMETLKSACSMQRDEIDRYKAECDRLKAIIEGLECRDDCDTLAELGQKENKCQACRAKQEAGK